MLSPHTDDGELGCGGTISRWIEEGKDIYYVAFSTCEKTVPDNLPKDILEKECRCSLKILGIPTNNTTILNFDVRTFPAERQDILDTMIKLKQKIKPELVLTPSSSDTHQDHQTIHWETIRAFKKEASILGYEHPWNNLTATFNLFIKLKDEHLNRKIEALNCYETQGQRSYFDEKYIRAHSYTRGMQVDIQNAEAFELIRIQI
ncbi:PIG-L deacetylase family protein [Chloroflexota bacterium]